MAVYGTAVYGTAVYGKYYIKASFVLQVLCGYADLPCHSLASRIRKTTARNGYCGEKAASRKSANGEFYLFVFREFAESVRRVKRQYAHVRQASEILQRHPDAERQPLFRKEEAEALHGAFRPGLYLHGNDS